MTRGRIAGCINYVVRLSPSYSTNLPSSSKVFQGLLQWSIPLRPCSSIMVIVLDLEDEASDPAKPELQPPLQLPCRPKHDSPVIAPSEEELQKEEQTVTSNADAIALALSCYP